VQVVADRTRGDTHRRRDLVSVEVGEDAQHEREPLLTREPLDCRGELEHDVVRPAARHRHEPWQRRVAPAYPPPFVEHAVDRAAADPRDRIVVAPDAPPSHERQRERLGDRVLGARSRGREHADQRPVVLAEHVVERRRARPEGRHRERRLVHGHDAHTPRRTRTFGPDFAFSCHQVTNSVTSFRQNAKFGTVPLRWWG
jgi:hypothetical protein